MTRDGYPEEHELRYIEEYDLTKSSAVALVEYVRELWRYEDYFTAEDDGEGLLKLEMHTGGWSGNEDVIEALQKNPLFFPLYWQSTFRGGHYYFEVELTERPEVMWKKRTGEDTGDGNYQLIPDITDRPLVMMLLVIVILLFWFGAARLWL